MKDKDYWRRKKAKAEFQEELKGYTLIALAIVLLAFALAGCSGAGTRPEPWTCPWWAPVPGLVQGPDLPGTCY